MRYFEPYIEFRSRALNVPIKAPGGEEIFIEITPGSSFGAEHKTIKEKGRRSKKILKDKTKKSI